MSDLIRLELGAAPWLPNTDAVAVIEYRYHDVPLEGVVEEAGVQFMFSCLDGAEGASWWLYARTDPDERCFIEGASTVKEFRARMDERPIHPPCAIAIAFENVGIVTYRILEGESGELDTAIDEMKAEVAELASEAADFELV